LIFGESKNERKKDKMKMDFREETARRWSWFYIYMPKWF
jgi:hypothetical protein